MDSDPVVLMYGSKPAYRPLRIGTEGADVKAFEANLSALGYDGFTVDDEYSMPAAPATDWNSDTSGNSTSSRP